MTSTEWPSARSDSTWAPTKLPAASPGQRGYDVVMTPMFTFRSPYGLGLRQTLSKRFSDEARAPRAQQHVRHRMECGPEVDAALPVLAVDRAHGDVDDAHVRDMQARQQVVRIAVARPHRPEIDPCELVAMDRGA